VAVAGLGCDRALLGRGVPGISSVSRRTTTLAALHEVMAPIWLRFDNEAYDPPPRQMLHLHN
jgi:hypothetical protein